MTNDFQQPRTQKVLTQIPPPLDEFITEVREKLTGWYFAAKARKRMGSDWLPF